MGSRPQTEEKNAVAPLIPSRRSAAAAGGTEVGAMRRAPRRRRGSSAGCARVAATRDLPGYSGSGCPLSTQGRHRRRGQGGANRRGRGPTRPWRNSWVVEVCSGGSGVDPGSIQRRSGVDPESIPGPCLHTAAPPHRTARPPRRRRRLHRADEALRPLADLGDVPALPEGAHLDHRDVERDGTPRWGEGRRAELLLQTPPAQTPGFQAAPMHAKLGRLQARPRRTLPSSATRVWTIPVKTRPV